MRRTFSLMVCLIALASAAALAQQAPAATQRGTTTTPVAAVQGGTPAPPAKAVDTGADLTDANITIEITVVDKPAGSGAPQTTRVGTITVANQSSGSVRGLSFWNGNSGQKLDPAGVDVDARTFLRKSGMVNVTLTVAYIPSGSEVSGASIQRQSATLFLKPGQETQVLTAGSMNGAGPAVRITAKATVNK